MMIVTIVNMLIVQGHSKGFEEKRPQKGLKMTFESSPATE
jgi:hypothetical protein